jgi:DNA-binding GntR family transcriptional regulator
MTELLRQKIYQSIRDDITFGRLSPGERLIESKLTGQFKAGRSSIREALRQLESEGLIRFNQDRVITVSKLSIEEIDEIYTLRWLLESFAARLTAERAIKKHVVHLRDLLKKMKAAAKANDLMNWLESNTSFHSFLSEQSGNKNLDQTLESLKRRVYRYKYITARIPGHFEEYIQHHEGILKACEMNNGDMAEKYMKLHIKTIKKVLIDYLKVFPAY